MNLDIFTLPNGLKVVLEAIESAQSVAIYVAVGAWALGAGICAVRNCPRKPAE